MKGVICLLGLLVSINIVSAQKEIPHHIIDLSGFESVRIPEKNPLVKDSLELQLENWDASQFNVYRNVKTQYPIHIQFTDSTFSSPIYRKKVVTSRFGWRWGRAHRGIDIDLVTGDSVLAILGGKVRYVDYHSGHGKTVVIRHDNGLESVYAHLSKQMVKVDQIVEKGEVIGEGGRTGNARGSHLHLELRYKGVAIHPEALFDFGKENKIRGQDIYLNKKWTSPQYHSSRRQSKIEVCNTAEAAALSLKKQKELYVIKRGDTLSKIAYKHHISLSRLCKINAISKNTTLKIGRKLTVSL